MLKETVEWCKPTRATKYSAGIDLYAKEDFIIGAGETKIVNLGVKIDPDFFVYEIAKVDVDAGGYVSIKEGAMNVNEFMKSHFIELHPRSSLRAKGLIVGVGVVDLDYDLEIGLIVHNPLRTGQIHTGYGETKLGIDIYKNYTINKGDKIAQVLLKEHKGFLFGIESDSERNGGYGSSGN